MMLQAKVSEFKVKVSECRAIVSELKAKVSLYPTRNETRHIAWRCKNKWNKEHKCYMRHLYDTKVHESITRAAFDVLKKRKDLIYEITNLTGITGDRITRTINKASASEFVGDYKLLETIVKRITVGENHDAEFNFIDGTKAKEHIAGTGKTPKKCMSNKEYVEHQKDMKACCCCTVTTLQE